MSKNLFNSIQLSRPNGNMFDLTHDVKLSFNMGELIPICLMECVPGDRFKIGCESLVRFAPLVSPVMHRFDLSMHYFFVPNRILWEEWETFITGDNLQGPSGPATTPAVPFFNMESVTPVYSRLADYLGIPNPIGANAETVSALPFAAYQKIYNDYYRDENLIADNFPGLASGSNTADYALFWGTLQKRAWEHDYFTSALPWTQKGNAVSLPLGDVFLKPSTTNPGVFRAAAAGHANDNWTGGIVSAGAGGEVTLVSGAPKLGVYDPNGTLEVGATTINDLRRAIKLQEWLEKNARGGTRYVEYILAHWGVKSSDQRLQRPEYIFGTKSPVVISEVLNTTGTVDLPQGNMSGHGVSVATGNYGKYYCEEHGWIMGIMSLLPKTAYQQGIPKHFLKFTDNFQYFTPEFANIGEQPVQNNEIFAFDPSTGGTFGYVPRYAEYKYMPSRVAGDFRTSLDFWHDGRIFATPPALNQEFVECVPDPRIFAVTDPDVQKMYAHVLNKVYAYRLMPKYGTPQF